MNQFELARQLETSIWEAALQKDSHQFLILVDESAVMVCGGYRCLAKEYAGFLEEDNFTSYEFLNFEVVLDTPDIIQVQYVIQVNAPSGNDFGGKFHVTSTWKKFDDHYKLIFNMDSRIFED